MDALLKDLRFAIRTLRKSPAFTVVALVTLALGIGATSTIFSVVNAVLLRSLPYANPEGLVYVWEHNQNDRDGRMAVSSTNFVDWRRDQRVFASMAAFREGDFNLAGNEIPERVGGTTVTGDFFRTLGVAPALGRGLGPDDDRPEVRTVVLSDALWRRQFAADRAALGRTVTLDGQSYTVVGVMPPTFHFPSLDAQLWVPAGWTEQQAGQNARGAHNWNVIARLAPKVTLAQADAAMRTIAARIEEQYPNFQRNFSAAVRPLHEEVVGDVRTPLLVLGGAVLLVLLIACANVANLLLARAATRQREMAIRSAIGASRRAIVRQLLAESVVLATAGAVIGLLLATWGTAAIAQFGDIGLPRGEEIAVDARVLLFTLAIAVGTGLLFGLAPALAASRADLGEVLKDGNKGSAGPGRGRTRGALLVAEVALSLMLLVGAGLLVQSFVRLQGNDLGFRPDGVLTAQVQLPRLTYQDTVRRAAFYEELTRRASALPGVRGAGVASGVPFSGGNLMAGYWVQGKRYADVSAVPVSTIYRVTPSYFSMLAVPLKRGRLLTDADRLGAQKVVLVSETLARQHFPGEEPIGQVVRPGNPEGDGYTIVGVVGDTKHNSLADAPPPQMYVPLTQFSPYFVTVMVKTEMEPASLAAALRREVQALDGTLPITAVRSYDALVGEAVARPRFTAALLGLFAALALVLAVVGIYGVIAHSVAQRTREFGIRLALGAGRGAVARQVLGNALGLTGAGIGVGVVAALLLSRLLESLLYGIT
ncbi:MAG TPA: ABC transporter permease, partial [Gemmatimonadaceae bacterium]|nr:ABC transporter permease [Gemmatimonadaceae bacterium]